MTAAMAPDLSTITERIQSLRQGVADGGDTPSLPELEDALCEGYACALASEAWSARTEQRLHELVREATRPGAEGELRTLTATHRDAELRVMELRRALLALREHFDRLRSAERAAST